MTVQNFQINFPGQSQNIVPRIGHLYAPGDTLSTIAGAGMQS